ncbi:hypothetical protein MAL04_20295 (plasmid) [Leptospira noguchii]|nr:hypothetical protein MAL04_20295 [Leptospira noguchii]
MNTTWPVPLFESFLNRKCNVVVLNLADGDVGFFVFRASIRKRMERMRACKAFLSLGER